MDKNASLVDRMTKVTVVEVEETSTWVVGLRSYRREGGGDDAFIGGSIVAGGGGGVEEG